jgi:hypothetical protein
MTSKPRGIWSGNKFWRHAGTYGRGIKAPSALKRWALQNPEEARRVRERFEKKPK